MTEGTKKRGFRGPKSNKILIIILAVALVAAIAGGVFIYMKYNDLKNNPDASQQAADSQATQLKEKVSKLISVPADETPVVATVTDKEKLKDQPFFADAENGDYILMFPSAKKAYIYREKETKLINVGPIAITSDGTTKTDSTK